MKKNLFALAVLSAFAVSSVSFAADPAPAEPATTPGGAMDSKPAADAGASMDSAAPKAHKKGKHHKKKKHSES